MSERFDVEGPNGSAQSESGFMGWIKSLTPITKIVIAGLAGTVVILTVVIIVVASSGSSEKDSPSPTPDPDPEPFTTHNVTFTENEGPLGNPTKGLVKWVDNKYDPGCVPTSMEFFKMPCAYLYPKENEINYTYFEENLELAKSHKRQVVVRLVLEDPGFDINEWCPPWLLKKANFTYSKDGSTHYCPDFESDKIISALEWLFQEMGKKYDGDPRIAYWELGTYGHYGEWHLTYAKNHSISDSAKDKYMNMLINNFKKTMLAVRRPEKRFVDKPIGFFHDCFAWEEYDEEMAGYFDQSGNEGLWDRWKTHTFGGELYPSKVKEFFGHSSLTKYFEEMANKFHVSWLTDNRFYKYYEDIISDYPNYMENRNKSERIMGYNYYATKAEIKLSKGSSDDKINASFNITVTNKGVAPFYLKWPIWFAVISINGNTVDIKQEKESDVFINGILPKEIHYWSYTLKDIPKSYSNCYYAFRIPSGIGTYVRLANNEQREDGWFIISSAYVS